MDKIEHSGRKIETRIEVDASPEEVWSAWADPKRIPGWFADRVSGETTTGKTLTYHWDKFGLDAPLEVLEVVPKLRSIFADRAPDQRLRITEVQIENLGGGRTALKLVESGFRSTSDWDGEYEGRNSGWKVALRLLKHYVENYPTKARKNFLVMRQAKFDYDKLRYFYREASGLAQWLTKSGAIGPEGSDYRLELRSGISMSGKVLAVTDYDVALSWPEFRGVITLKGFGACGSDEQAFAISGDCWDGAIGRFAEVESSTNEAADRLSKLLSG